MWRLLKEMLKGKTGSNTYKEVRYGDKVLNDAKEMANTMNQYFIDSLELKKDNYIESRIVRNSKYTNSELKEFKKIDCDSLNKIIQKLKNKSGTEEGLSVEIIKIAESVASKKLCELYNKSLEEGIFPSTWKEATVIPVPKVRGTIKIEEFRPINKLPIYEKILEKIVHKQLMEYLEENKLFSESQSGFRVNHSCETALQWVITGWKKVIGEGKIIGAVFLDLRRAFEVVNRDILLEKLERCGIKENVLKWFRDYLSCRTQRVKINGILSEATEV